MKWPELLPEAAARMPVRLGPGREEFDAALVEMGLAGARTAPEDPSWRS